MSGRSQASPEQRAVMGLSATCRRLNSAIQSDAKRKAEAERKLLVLAMAGVLDEFGLSHVAQDLRRNAVQEFMREEDMTDAPDPSPTAPELGA